MCACARFRSYVVLVFCELTIEHICMLVCCECMRLISRVLTCWCKFIGIPNECPSYEFALYVLVCCEWCLFT